jgi:hypothetical protein
MPHTILFCAWLVFVSELDLLVTAINRTAKILGRESQTTRLSIHLGQPLLDA